MRDGDKLPVLMSVGPSEQGIMELEFRNLAGDVVFEIEGYAEELVQFAHLIFRAALASTGGTIGKSL